MPKLIPLSLYIHMPWCIKKCPYCDFNSHAIKKDDNESDYINALITDLREEASLAENRTIESIFIGGGTPSLISAQGYETLFRAISKQLSLAENIEITLEANPGSVESARFKSYRELGINRLSIGVQSFNDAALKRLGRIHSSEQAKSAITTAIESGFDNFNLDIMHGLPEQSARDAEEDVKTALSFNPTHLSWYQLTIEPNTLFYKTNPTLPDEETLARIEKRGLLLLEDFRQYEVSAFCRDNRLSKHNLNYWTFGDYLAIGAGASGKVTTRSGITRRKKKTNPNHYMNAPTTATKTIIKQDEQLFEFMLNSLRLKQKVPLSLIQERTFVPWPKAEAAIQKAKETQMLDVDTQHFWVTPLGERYLNDLQSFFLE